MALAIFVDPAALVGDGLQRWFDARTHLTGPLERAHACVVLVHAPDDRSFVPGAQEVLDRAAALVPADSFPLLLLETFSGPLTPHVRRVSPRQLAIPRLTAARGVFVGVLLLGCGGAPTFIRPDGSFGYPTDDEILAMLPPVPA